MKRKTGVMLVLCMLLTVSSVCSASSQSADLQSEEADSELVFETVTIDGKTAASDIFSEAALTMVNVWATYCSPCLKEMPVLAELSQEYESEDFQIIGIISDVWDDSSIFERDTAMKMIHDTGADYPHLLANLSLYSSLLSEVMVVPTTFFVDADGGILDTVLGSQSRDYWEEMIDALLEKM